MPPSQEAIRKKRSRAIQLHCPAPSAVATTVHYLDKSFMKSPGGILGSYMLIKDYH